MSFQDKNNLVRVDVHGGPAPTTASVTAELAKLKAQAPEPQGADAAGSDLKGKSGDQGHVHDHERAQLR